MSTDLLVTDPALAACAVAPSTHNDNLIANREIISERRLRDVPQRVFGEETLMASETCRQQRGFLCQTRLEKDQLMPEGSDRGRIQARLLLELQDSTLREVKAENRRGLQEA